MVQQTPQNSRSKATRQGQSSYRQVVYGVHGEDGEVVGKEITKNT